METDGRGRHALCRPKWVFFRGFKSVCCAFGCTRVPSVSQHSRLLAMVRDFASSQSIFTICCLCTLACLPLSALYLLTDDRFSVSILPERIWSIKTNMFLFLSFAAVRFLKWWWLGRRPRERWWQSSVSRKKRWRGRRRASKMKSPCSGGGYHVTGAHEGVCRRTTALSNGSTMAQRPLGSFPFALSNDSELGRWCHSVYLTVIVRLKWLPCRIPSNHHFGSLQCVHTHTQSYTEYDRIALTPGDSPSSSRPWWVIIPPRNSVISLCWSERARCWV